MVSPAGRSGTIINNSKKNSILLETIKNRSLPRS